MLLQTDHSFIKDLHSFQRDTETQRSRKKGERTKNWVFATGPCNRNLTNVLSVYQMNYFVTDIRLPSERTDLTTGGNFPSVWPLNTNPFNHFLEIKGVSFLFIEGDCIFFVPFYTA